MSQCDHEEAQRGADPRLYVEALVGNMRWMMRVELEQVNEQLDRVENANRRQPQMALNVYRRERVLLRHVVVDFEEFNEGSFKEKDDRHSVGSVRRFGWIRKNRIGRIIIWSALR